VIALRVACGLVVPPNNPERDIERKLRVNPEWFLVGESGGEIVASCTVGYEGHRGWINYPAVRPDGRRCGLARRIMAEAQRLLRAAGCPKISLQVRFANSGAIESYRRLGLQVGDVVSMGRRLEPDRRYPGS